jgi:dolichyl-phosphate-mannose--protein O-mannosyl transferase
MIQRIQTLYLLISAVLIALLLVLPFAEILSEGAIYQFNISGISLDGAVKNNGIFLMVLIGLAFVLNGYSILSYKNRTRQARVVIITLVMLLAIAGIFVYYTYFSFSGSKVSFKIGAVLPVIAIILDYLAIRAINKDEALIRSIDRIR